jgi:hypothetical protein
LYFDDNGLIVTNDAPTKENLKSLHKTIKKVAEDIEGFFNTSVSQFMICANESSVLKLSFTCNLGVFGNCDFAVCASHRGGIMVVVPGKYRFHCNSSFSCF